ncbi:hypothetical protein [Inediibacterium massiliense]|uniref:hypothetical protein n=1 Tax=Inediibacterium massiliense TaxID=1658111 RepID=UPI0006B56753|nr:hypothetical protein [Inediibacterium massiliense]
MKKIWITLLVGALLTGCVGQEIPKNKVMTEKVQQEENMNQEELIKNARDSYKKYFKRDMDTDGLTIKTILMEKDDYVWPNDYWRVVWVDEKDKQKYRVGLDTKTGQIVEMVDTKSVNEQKNREINLREEKEKALAFIKENNIVEDTKNLELSHAKENGKISDFGFCYGENNHISIELDHEKVVDLYHTKRKNFNNQDVKVKKEEAVSIAIDGVEKYFDKKINRNDFVENINLVDGKNKNTWFIYWQDVEGELDYKDITYGAQVDAESGKLVLVEGLNKDLKKPTQKINEEEEKEIAMKYLEKVGIKGAKYEGKTVNEYAEYITFSYENKKIELYIDPTEKKVHVIVFR